MIQFDIQTEQRNNIIKVIGVGGGGGNAINHMYRMGIKDVDFIICNTDAQALDSSPIPTKIYLGKTLTEGLGAGSNPEIGRKAAEESREEIEQLLHKNTKMVFITAGMGGGTGTGAAPVIARIAKDLGILTIGIITTPFMREGRRKRNLAEQGIKELRENTDSVILVNNDKLPLLFGNLSMNAAFAKADDVLCTAAKGISELITITGRMNVDFADVRNAMTDSGSALMGIGEANGQNRAIEAINAALESPLLNDANVNGAEHVLANITYGRREFMMDEFDQIMEYIEDAVGENANIKIGDCYDESLEDQLRVTLIVTGFEVNNIISSAEKNIVSEISAKPAELPVSIMVEPASSPMNQSEDVRMTLVEKKEETPLKNENFAFQNYDQNWNVNTPEKTEQEEVKKITYLNSNAKIIDPLSSSPVHENHDIIQTTLSLDEMEMLKRSEDRTSKLKGFNFDLNKPVEDMEDQINIPAYLRSNLQLDEEIHSSERISSNLTLNTENNDKPLFRTNNSFFDPEVD
ncbi:MAG: cell division protein FtsZ [Bacteroidetes bacterium]|nr:cell division protein FtsZ [Bacteroidota bacterium]